MSGEFIIEGMGGLLSAFDKFAEELNKRQLIAAELAANAYNNDVKNKITEIGLYKSGNYRQSWHVEPGTDMDGIPYALTGTNRTDAKQHEFGGFIKAKNAKFLHWIDEQGRDCFAKIVYQPPHQHARPVLDLNREKYQGIIVQEMFK